MTDLERECYTCFWHPDRAPTYSFSGIYNGYMCNGCSKENNYVKWKQALPSQRKVKRDPSYYTQLNCLSLCKDKVSPISFQVMFGRFPSANDTEIIFACMDIKCHTKHGLPGSRRTYRWKPNVWRPEGLYEKLKYWFQSKILKKECCL